MARHPTEVHPPILENCFHLPRLADPIERNQLLDLQHSDLFAFQTNFSSIRLYDSSERSHCCHCNPSWYCRRWLSTGDFPFLIHRHPPRSIWEISALKDHLYYLHSNGLHSRIQRRMPPSFRATVHRRAQLSDRRPPLNASTDRAIPSLSPTLIFRPNCLSGVHPHSSPGRPSLNQTLRFRPSEDCRSRPGPTRFFRAQNLEGIQRALKQWTIVSLRHNRSLQERRPSGKSSHRSCCSYLRAGQAVYCTAYAALYTRERPIDHHSPICSISPAAIKISIS